MSTGRVSITTRRVHGSRVHLRGKPEQGNRTRCGNPPPLWGGRLRVVDSEEEGVTCRMCLRCLDVDNGLRLTR